MIRFRLTPAAAQDLSPIWDFTMHDWGVRQAETYVNEVRFAILRIADDPERGRPCDEIRDGYRRCGIGHHLIFYLEHEDGVDVIRILHQRMDPTRQISRDRRRRRYADIR